MRIAILGPLEVTVDGERVRLGGARAEKLLAALALEANRAVPVSRLVDVLWDDDPPATAIRQVQNIAGMLRKIIGGVLVTDGSGYRLRVGDGQLDTRDFERAAAEAERAAGDGDLEAAVEHARAALGLWRGAMFAGLDIPVLAAAVAGWEERRLALTENRIDWELRQGRHREHIADIRALVLAHPTRERLVGQLMLALYRAGRQAEALSVHQRTRQVLADELGLDPGHDLRRLHERILAGDPELDLARPSPPQPAAGPEPDKPHPTRRRRRTRVLATGGTLAGAALILLAVLPNSAAPRTTPPPSATPSVLINESGATAVAAFFDRDGGVCPPLSPSPEAPHCGTCDVPSQARSTDSCGWLSAAIDAFTFDRNDFSLDSTPYAKHTYVRIPPGTTVHCGIDGARPACRTRPR